jgi:hypothetical protein
MISSHMIPLSGFNTWGTPHAGFGQRAQFSRAVESHLSTLSPGPIRWLGEATLHLSDLMGGLRMSTHPLKSGHINIMISQVIKGVLIHGLPTT